MPKFAVLPPKRARPGFEPQAGSYVLRPMPVDDDGFRTTWRLSRTRDDGTLEEIGSVKILRSGQFSGRTPLDADFDELGPEYASLGAEIDFYVRLKDTAGAGALPVLRALGDIATDRVRRDRFENEPGFQASLVRFSPARAALEEAEGLFTANVLPATAAAVQELVFQTSTGGAPFVVSFDLDADVDIPSRINVLIGPNGSGKTRLLANLALAAFEPDGEGPGQPWGRFEGPLRFSRVLAFSYSAFDEFDLPAQTKAERQAFSRASSGLGYRYFGLRDLAPGGKEPGLKTVRQVAADFRRACDGALEQDDGLFLEITSALLREPSFAMMGLAPLAGDARDLRQRLSGIFRQASTGHKFVLLMAAQLVASLRPDTLVLIDEPEANLHPPLLAAFLTILRRMLAARAAHAIIATHSPFIVQETPARYVRVISRHVHRTSVSTPATETYGEDIGTITRDVFRLNSRVGEFVEVLRALADRYSIEEIEARFDNGLSGQGRSIVAAAQARRRR